VTVTQVYALTEAVRLRYRALILLAAFTSLRWAELTALRPEDIDLDALTVRVTRQLYYHRAGYSFGAHKSRAGVRVVDFPELIVPDVREHLDWLPALAAVGLEGIHLHDLRHTGNQLTAAGGGV
jgi:integrase